MAGAIQGSQACLAHSLRYGVTRSKTSRIDPTTYHLFLKAWRHPTCLRAEVVFRYFNAPESKEETLDPPLAFTKLVSTGTNFPAMPGDRPNFWKDPATEAKPPNFPGSAPVIPEIPETPGIPAPPDAAGAD